MYKELMERTRPGVTESDILRIESQLSSTLPKDYRDFLLNCNGGEPKRACFEIPGFEDDFWIDWLCWADEHGATPNEWSDYEALSFEIHQNSDIVPAGYLIIGVCCRDDFLLLGVTEKNHGRMMYKRMHEVPGPSTDDWPKQRDMGVHPLANSFSEYFSSLRSCE